MVVTPSILEFMSILDHSAPHNLHQLSAFSAVVEVVCPLCSEAENKGVDEPVARLTSEFVSCHRNVINISLFLNRGLSLNLQCFNCLTLTITEP